jgi:acetoin utilization deacetylase AcuC-like enzyme
MRQDGDVLLVAADPGDDRHDAGEGHPEQPGRLDAALRGLVDAELTEAVLRLPPRSATFAELELVHDPAYLTWLAELSAQGGGQIDADTRASAGSWDTACRTAGGGLAALDALMAGLGIAAFVLGRPPGHHATRHQAMGFCLINHVAVTAAALAERGERVAIIDWDVHHGNGTQDIFWNDPRVMYVSVHQWPLYPGTGRPEERGAGAGWGATLNLPMPPRTTGDAYLALFDEVVAPCVARFAPTWVLISAGFDAHRDDPLAEMLLTAGDFADLTNRVLALAGGAGRTIAFLEGGYSPPALQASVGACAAALVGAPFRPEASSSGGAGHARVAPYRAAFVDE